MSVNPILDEAMRRAAFEHVRQLGSAKDHVTSSELAAGFEFEGKRIPLVNPQRGIFKPRQMRFLLSIRTVFPKPGARIWYDDQRHVHRQLYESKDFVDYAFMGSDPDAADNRWLREACEQRIPIIYFIGCAPGQFAPVVPSYIAEWDRHALKASVGTRRPSLKIDSRTANWRAGTRCVPSSSACIKRRFAKPSYLLTRADAHCQDCPSRCCWMQRISCRMEMRHWANRSCRMVFHFPNCTTQPSIRT